MREMIENLLLEKGVPREHIEKMKVETSINSREYYERYKSTRISKEELVDTRKIKGVGNRLEDTEERILATVDGGYHVTPAYTVDYDRLSWFDYISMKDEGLTLSKGKILDIYYKFEEKSLQENYDYYSENGVDPGSGSLTKLAYFEDEDIYAVAGDGTHRTLWAKVSGAPYLLAYVYYYKKIPLNS
ncbi:hypothetical protein [Planococcus sp. ISL-109]|uniref:hypothetical protein n=1 Tax=Planococcus sp. ISL-109 TaxID=2819166 RepID=UPI001BEAC684|nr:hypothetical protein [Planococcus sp. ISL-109]MBT2584253.1 hypothetical protein [Planococcus sp. ISL-109]